VEYKLFLMPAGVTLKEWLKNPSPLVQTKFIQS
jgi:hypothetical protein